MPDEACLSAMTLVTPRPLSLAASSHGIVGYSSRGDARRSASQKKSRFRTNKLMKTGIIEDRQSLGRRRQECAPPPRVPGREVFKFRTNKLLEAGIIVRSQELGRSLSAGRASRFGAEHTPGV